MSIGLLGWQKWAHAQSCHFRLFFQVFFCILLDSFAMMCHLYTIKAEVWVAYFSSVGSHMS